MCICLSILILILIITTSNGLTHPSRFGADSSHISKQLVFDVTAQEIVCFYEYFKEATELKIAVRIVDQQAYMLFLKIISPTEKINTWKRQLDQIEYTGTIAESGIHEICTNVNRPFGQTRFALDIFALHAGDVSHVLMEMQNRVDVERGIANTFRSFYYLKYANLQVTKDTNLQESNVDYIDRFSMFQSVIIFACAFIQIYVIRRLFDVDTKRMRA